ncbi:MAG: hypothetical protein ACI8TX_003526 [Hyphomicrobiaceae bacterium]|jgi:hypothetical protein
MSFLAPRGPRPITALAYRLARALRSNITLGDIIAPDCFRPRWRRDYEFATHRYRIEFRRHYAA